MSKRLLPDWIAAYLKYTEETEPPKSYHTWVAISVIAAALQRRTYLRWGRDTIYPNLYVILVGPSGRARKGTAMKMGWSVLREVKGVTLTSESITREALIRAMKGAVTNFADGKDIRFQCAISCISPELSVFLGQKDIKFLSNLTDWYDSSDEWTYETKGAGTDAIQGVCFNLLGGTAPDWMQSILPQEAVGGGFTSRCIFIVEENKGKVVPKEVLTEEDKRLWLALRNDLEIISTICGEAKFDEEGEQAYLSWYTEQEKKISDGEFPIDDMRFAGYCDRRATHVRKLCLVMAASRGLDRTITKRDFDRALDVLEKAEIKMPRAFGGLGRSQYSEMTQLVIELLMKYERITRSDLLRLYYREIDTVTLKIIEETVEQMKIAKITRDVMNNEVIYEYIRKA